MDTSKPTKYWMTTGPGESRIVRVDGRGEPSVGAEREKIMPSISERISELEQEVAELEGGSPTAENRGREPQFYDWSYNYAKSEGDETADNADGSETNDSPYYDWGFSYTETDS